MNTSDLKTKKIAILGLGIEGVALAEFFDNEGIEYFLLDILPEEKLINGAGDESLKDLENLLGKLSSDRKVFGGHYLDNLKDYDVIFRSPGIPYLHEKIQEAKNVGAVISSQIKLFFDLCPVPIIGVTGTKGKGTTASLILEILKKNFQSSISNNQAKRNVFLAGNIGKSAISLLKDIQLGDWVILELSSFQLQDLEKSPHIAVVLNISQDHLDYHKDVVEYHEAKQSIVKYQTEKDFVVINQDYLTSFEFAALTPAKKYYFSSKSSIDEGAFVKTNSEEHAANSIKEVVLRYDGEDKVICRSDEIQLVGGHNLANIAAAAVTARIAGASADTISEVSKSFVGLPHRLEFVREVNGVKFYNDSFATNPEPTIAAIESFSQPKILILGGSSKGADFSLLARKIFDGNVKACILIGEEADKIILALYKENFDGQVVKIDSSEIDEIVKASMEVAESGDIVILSPACASFGLFRNYKDRGNKFKSSVERMNA